MRTDRELTQKLGASEELPTRRAVDGTSLSGLERNQVFLSRGAEQFENVSGISGADDVADARGFSLLDFDRDGWQDIAIVNANAPLLQLFRNQVGERGEWDGAGAGFLAVRFEGGNHNAQPAAGWSSRDGYGAVVSIELPGATLVREHRAGEGLAAQNSATMLVGIGAAPQVERIHVRWPSGREQTLEGVTPGSLVTCYENETQAPGHSGFEIARYALPSPPERRPATQLPRRRLDIGPAASLDSRAAAPRLRLLVTMATWCAVCRGELPELAQLRGTFAADDLGIYGVPVDPADDAAKLAAYREAQRPAYQLLADAPRAWIDSVRELVTQELRIEALPAALLTTADGEVLWSGFRVPTVSETRILMAGHQDR